MNRFLAALILVWRFFSAMLMSAWATSKTILFDSEAPKRGYAKLDYGNLSEPGVMILAALVTLTPGTSTLDIDTEKKELLLHVLDNTDIESLLDNLRHDFMEPLLSLFGTIR